MKLKNKNKSIKTNITKTDNNSTHETVFIAFNVFLFKSKTNSLKSTFNLNFSHNKCLTIKVNIIN